MRIKLVYFSLICVLAFVFATSAQAVLVDDFSVAGLPEYTLSRVNDGNTTANIGFTDTTGDLRVNYTSTPNAYEQVLLLRDDYQLSVGQTLYCDVASTLTGWDRDIGIAVGWTETPPSLSGSTTGDVRTSYVEVSFRSNNQVVSYARKDGVNLASGQEFSGTSYGGVSFTAPPEHLFISRIETNKFIVGWVDNGLAHIVTSNGTVIQPYNFTGATNVPGAAVGFYADVRTAIASSPTGLDNLQILPVTLPEPSTVVMTLIGLVGMGLLWLRRK
jgi:hypothetical protein